MLSWACSMRSLQSTAVVICAYIVLLSLLHSSPQHRALGQDTDLPIYNKSENFFTVNASLTSLQNFTSPDYPKDYPSYSSCAWVIAAPLGQLIKLTFSAFSIYAPSNDDSKQCPYAYVRVIEQDSQGRDHSVGRFCGNRKPQTIYSSGGQLRVEFKNMFRILARGFVAKYTAIQPGTACSPTNTVDENSNILLHSSMGQITSPQFPPSYPHPMDCTWKVSLPSNQAINLTFSSFSKVQRAICSDSSLEIYNSRYGQGHGEQLGMYCGAVVPPILYSNGPYLSLRLKANRPENVLSFVGTYHSLMQEVNGSCDNSGRANTININAAAGSIFTPDYPDDYPSNKDCTWSITVPTGLNVRLKFHAFDLSSDVTCADYVEVRDVDNLSSPLKERFCGSVAPPDLISNSRHMEVRFKSNYGNKRKGFLAVFEATTQKPEVTTTPRIIPGVCSAAYDTSINNNLQLSGASGVIQSPNYPAQYPNTISCTWVITVAKDNIVKLTFDDFWIDDQSGCHGDYLEVRDGSKSSSPPLGQRYCGNKEPADMVSSSSYMWVHFTSDQSATGQGFKAKYTAVRKPFNRFIVVGIAIGAIVIVLVLILIYCKVKKKREKDMDDEEFEHEDEENGIELQNMHPHADPLLGNKADTPNNGAPPNDYDVTYAPNGNNGHPVVPYKEDEQLTTEGPPVEYAWFKPKKRKSKGFE